MSTKTQKTVKGKNSSPKFDAASKLAELKKKYSHVSGNIRRHRNGKISVEIECKDDRSMRRVYSSDLFQVSMSAAGHRAARLAAGRKAYAKGKKA